MQRRCRGGAVCRRGDTLPHNTHTHVCHRHSCTVHTVSGDTRPPCNGRRPRNAAALPWWWSLARGFDAQVWNAGVSRHSPGSSPSLWLSSDVAAPIGHAPRKNTPESRSRNLGNRGRPVYDTTCCVNRRPTPPLTDFQPFPHVESTVYCRPSVPSVWFHGIDPKLAVKQGGAER